MTSPTRFRFSASAIERWQCPAGRKAVELSDIDCPGLKIAITPHQRIFWFRFRLRGVKGALRLGQWPALSIADARRLALAARAKVDQGLDPRLTEPELDMTFAEWAEVYLAYSRQHKRSHADDASRLRCWWLNAKIARMRLRDIRRRDIEGHLSTLKSKLSPATVNRHLTLVSAMCRRAVAFEYIERNPCSGISRLVESGPRQQSLTPEQAARLLDVLRRDKNRIAASALALMLYSGTRKMECLASRWEHIDFNNRLWMLPRTKSLRTQYVHLADAAVRILEEMPGRSERGWIFPGRNPTKHLADPRKVLARALVAAGMPADHLCVHGLRHAHASIMVGSGRRTLAEAQFALRHASPRTTMAYLHLSAESGHQAVQSVSDAIQQARDRLAES